MFSIFLFLLVQLSLSQTCLTNPYSVTHSPAGTDISWEDLGSSTYLTTLELKACSFDISPGNIASFISRCYNNTIPGPTFRMKRGNIYKIKLINSLGPENSADESLQLNQFRHPNHTNIHTHGLHISGSYPGDYVFQEIAPGNEFTFTYYLPCNHAGGTFWYHPHLHGSTAVQVGGGAIGIIIVEDDSDMEGLPDWLSDMSEIILGIYYISLPDMLTWSTTDDLFDYTADTGELTAFHLVNGEYQPTICVNANEWYRFRISYANVKSTMSLYMNACQLRLISKDGVLIHGSDNSVPRTVNFMWFTPGSRADLAVYCPGHSSGSITYNMLDTQNNIIAYIEVTGTDTIPSFPASSLSTFNPIRPSYLVDLQSYTGDFHQFCGNPTPSPTQGNAGPGQPPPPPGGKGRRRLNQLTCSDKVVIPISPNSIYGIPFVSEDNYFWNISVGSVVEFEISAGSVSGLNHPFHMHINHVQLISGGTGGDSTPTNWHETGDYLDVVQGDSVIRWYADTYGGTVNIHCHILEHEDEGAMGTFWITGGCDAADGDIGDGSVCSVPVCENTTDPTVYPTVEPSINPSNEPSDSPMDSPTVNPSLSPTVRPSLHPSINPSNNPSVNPTDNPSTSPLNDFTGDPSISPSVRPSLYPTINPTKLPSETPSVNPTTMPSLSPQNDPTIIPTNYPSDTPSNLPSQNPSVIPSTEPTNTPSKSPQNDPVVNPTTIPSGQPSNTPTNNPTLVPSNIPFINPSNTPTLTPTQNPTNFPTKTPSYKPSKSPVIQPTNNPGSYSTSQPSDYPTTNPSNNPTLSPTYCTSNTPFDITFSDTAYPQFTLSTPCDDTLYLTAKLFSIYEMNNGEQTIRGINRFGSSLFSSTGSDYDNTYSGSFNLKYRVKKTLYYNVDIPLTIDRTLTTHNSSVYNSETHSITIDGTDWPWNYEETDEDNYLTITFSIEYYDTDITITNISDNSYYRLKLDNGFTVQIPKNTDYLYSLNYYFVTSNNVLRLQLFFNQFNEVLEINNIIFYFDENNINPNYIAPLNVSNNSNNSSFFSKYKMVIISLIIVFLVIIVLILVYWYKRRKNKLGLTKKVTNLKWEIQEVEGQFEEDTIGDLPIMMPSVQVVPTHSTIEESNNETIKNRFSTTNF